MVNEVSVHKRWSTARGRCSDLIPYELGFKTPVVTLIQVVQASKRTGKTRRGVCGKDRDKQVAACLHYLLISRYIDFAFSVAESS